MGDPSPSPAAGDGGDGGNGRTTVLPPGAVESRNYGAPLKISAEIQAFLAGTDGEGGALGPRSELRALFTVWMFLTRLPGPAWVDLHPGFLMRGMCHFPVVGSVLGGAYAVVFDCLDVSLRLPSAAAAALAVGCGLYITGCFHEDGLADCADGLGGGWSRSQALRIMTDSRVGTFGCAALGLFLLLKVQLLDSLGRSRWELAGFQTRDDSAVSSGAGPAMLVAQTVSRLSAPYLIRTRDYVAEVGPKSPFYLFMIEAKHLVSWSRVFFASAYCFVVSSMIYGPVFAMLLILAVLAVAHLAGNKGDYLLGGVMGDFLGGTICICEISVLTFIVAKDAIIETYRGVIASISVDDSLNPLQQMIAIYNSDRLRPLIHFIFLTVVMKVWCTLVGPPDMYDREDEKNKKESKRD